MRFTNSSKSMASAGSPVYFPYLINFILRLCSRSSLVVLSPWRPSWQIPFAMLHLLRLFRVEAALFAASNAAMRPQPFQNHFRRCCGRGSVSAVLRAELSDMLHQSLDFRKLLAALDGRRQLRQLQLTAEFEPLNDWLKVHVGKMLAEHSSERRTNQFARDAVRSFQFAFILQFHFSGDRRERGINIRRPRNRGLFAAARRALLRTAHHAFERGNRQP